MAEARALARWTVHMNGNGAIVLQHATTEADTTGCPICRRLGP